jgi:hypothetical protein
MDPALDLGQTANSGSFGEIALVDELVDVAFLGDLH